MSELDPFIIAMRLCWKKAAEEERTLPLIGPPGVESGQVVRIRPRRIDSTRSTSGGRATPQGWKYACSGRGGRGQPAVTRFRLEGAMVGDDIPSSPLTTAVAPAQQGFSHPPTTSGNLYKFLMHRDWS